MHENYLELNNIKKIYPNGFQAIFNLNLKIKKGEFVIFVGPSGCGKSTTIRMIAGLEDISSGEMILDQRNATNLPARKRNISMVFQNYALFPHLTVKENIAFTLKTKRAPREKIEVKVKWAAKILKLEYLLNRKPAQLSGGQRQRVALGRAMVADSKLFLMDEPLSNLDAKLRSTMRSTIRKLHNELDTTTIYVTHDQVEAMTMADKIIVMSDGFIQQIGTPVEVFEEPANKFVARFIGTPMINIVDGEYRNNTFNTKYGTIKINKQILRKTKTKIYQLAFRPQYATISKTKLKYSLALNVFLVEILGAETICHTQEGMQIVVLTDKKPKVGDKIYVTPNHSKIILFDKVQGISLTSKINLVTMESLEIFYKSQKLVQARTALLEKQKNKKMNEGILAKIISHIERLIYPDYIILNKEYAFLKEAIRKSKKHLQDLKRTSQATTKQMTIIAKHKTNLQTHVKSLRAHRQELAKFKTIYHKEYARLKEAIRKSKKHLQDLKRTSQATTEQMVIIAKHKTNLQTHVKSLHAHRQEIAKFKTIYHKEYARLKETIRKSKKHLQDLKRKATTEQMVIIAKHKTNLQTHVKSLRAHRQEMAKFKTIYQKITTSINALEKMGASKLLTKMKKIKQLGDSIKIEFNAESQYDFDKLNKFINDYQKSKSQK